MENLILGEIFNIVSNSFKVTENDIFLVYNQPDKNENYHRKFTLRLKKLNDKHLSYLLIAIDDEQNSLIFCYWIPESLIKENLSLITILESFATYFGCKIKILEQESFFIKEINVRTREQLQSPFQIMKILGPEDIPCEAYLLCREKLNYHFNSIDCFCCFAINNNKYLLWVHNIETTLIKIKSGWESYLNKIVEQLSPFETTKLEILTKKKGINDVLQNPENDSVHKIDFKIPKRYSKVFKRIADVIDKLQKDEEILILKKPFIDLCVFCGETDMSSEHIFPKWMKAYFDKKELTPILIRIKNFKIYWKIDLL